MTTLRDMPMISVEQKNAFREAALKVEAELTQVETSNHTIGRQMGEVQEMLIQVREERDTLAAWLDECLSAMRHASEFLDEFDKDAALAFHRMNSLSSRSRGPADSLAARDARMKAEALEALNPHDLSRFAKSIGEDAWDMNPVGICKLVNRMATLHREQAATEAMDAIDGEDGDFANVRGVVERMIAAGYRKQAEGNGDE